jgi:hypothetical protein
MKDVMAVISVIFTIVAIVVLILVDPEPAARAFEVVIPSWIAPWTTAGAVYSGPVTVTGHRSALYERSATVDAQPSTGFERGIAFGPNALNASPARATPAAVDLSQMTLAAVQKADLIRFPDGCSVVYLGRGQLGTRCDEHGQ